MRPFGRLIALGLLIAATGGQDVGSALSGAVTPVGEARETGGFTFRMTTPRVSLIADPGGTVQVEIEGFVRPEGPPGAPDLPTRTVLVAIPPGVEPRLDVTELGVSLHPGVRPRPFPHERVTVAPEEPGASHRSDRPLPEGAIPDSRIHRRYEYLEDSAVYQGSNRYPARVAWLGRIGVLRDQRYVQVHVAPVRHDPAIDGLHVTESLELRVTFEGDDGRRTAPAGGSPLESVYRKTFVNYAQGLTFRLGALAEVQGPAVSPSVDDATLQAQPVRIVVRENGIVRLDHTRMQGTDFLNEPLSDWKLTSRGHEVPLEVFGDGLLDPGESVQFYGQALDDEPETVLNTDIPNAQDDLYEARDFTDDNVYFLTAESGARSRIATQAAAPINTPPPPDHFQAVAHVEDEDAWRPLGAADPWYWGPSQATNGQVIREEMIDLPGLYSGTEPVQVRVHLRGLNGDDNVDPDHHTRVTLMNSSDQVLEINDDDGTFDGRTLYLHDFPWDFTGGAQLTDPATVEIEARDVPGIDHSFILDYIEIEYRRSFDALNNVLEFEWPDEDAEFVVGGFSNLTIAVYEITGRVNGGPVVEPVRLTGGSIAFVGGTFEIKFRMDNDLSLPDGTPRRFLVVAEGAASVPGNADFENDTVSDLRDNATQADLIVIAHPNVLDDPQNCSSTLLTQLLNLRASQGISSKVTCLRDVQDEFNDGLEGPLAIKNFLSWVMSDQPGEGWADPRPFYVLLLGDGSYEYKNGPARGNLIPTQILFRDRVELGYYASDEVEAAVVGDDQLADLVIGRIPARNVSQANDMLQKILGYEQMPPTGNWRRHALFVSDRGKGCNQAEGLDFEATNQSAESFMKTPPHTSRKLEFWSGPYCDDQAGTCEASTCNEGMMRNDIKDAVNGVDGISDGASIVQFQGHGNFDVWSDEAFLDNRLPGPDTDDLDNSDRLPWLLVHNCLTGGFHTPATRAMGEDWLKKSDGGSVAVFAPSGLSFNFFGRTVSDVIWEDLFGPPKERNVAVPVMDVWARLCGQGSTEACQHYILLGDPAQSLIFPSVDPPTSVTAGSQHQQVQLDWTAPTGIVSQELYRTTDPDRIAYQPVATLGPTDNSYLDTGLVNTTTYYYYLIALDSEGFESAWSNFNSDCDVDGPDCVKATPLNPDPPSRPTGVQVIDAEVGGRLEVNWSTNPENDVIHYEVHYSTQPGCYDDPGCTPTTRNVARETSDVINGLENGVEYFIVVTATNSSGLTSEASVEDSDTPTLVRGVKSPQVIGDLRIDKSGNDAVLSWSAVTTDIYGKLETVDFYEVFRGTTPDFTIDEGVVISPPGFTDTTFTDVDALLPSVSDYYYLVRAVDIDGNVGGLGRQLPDGIGDMEIGKSSTTPGKLVLSWTEIETVFGSDDPTLLDHYEIYASSQPFRREDVDGMIPLMSVTETSVELTPPPEDQYYSVISVDNRGNKSPF